MNTIKKIVLTGGPGGGKTEALKRLVPELEKCGCKVFPVFEAAESVIKDGHDRETDFDFQKTIYQKQVKDESQAYYNAIVSEGDIGVVICDRGLMDARVYLNDEDYSRLKDELKVNDIFLRDFYDAAFHLDSTSNSDSAEYYQEGIRIEDEVSAQALNERSLRAWCGNPHYRFIPVCESFEEKLSLLLKEIKAFLGIPKPLEIERKFLIEYPDTDFLLSLPCAKVEISQSYISETTSNYRLRKRGADGNYIFIRTEKKHITDTVREEVENLISADEYKMLIDINNLTGKITGTIEKDRYCLMYDGVYYEIDIFPFWKKQAYLEVELSDENDDVVIPDFIKVIKEVTNDPSYKNSRLCKNIPEESI